LLTHIVEFLGCNKSTSFPESFDQFLISERKDDISDLDFAHFGITSISSLRLVKGRSLQVLGKNILNYFRYVLFQAQGWCDIIFKVSALLAIIVIVPGTVAICIDL